MMGNKQLEKIICIACNEMFVDHSKRQLIRCLFRIQSTMISDELNSTGNDVHTPDDVMKHELEDK